MLKLVNILAVILCFLGAPVSATNLTMLGHGLDVGVAKDVTYDNGYAYVSSLDFGLSVLNAATNKVVGTVDPPIVTGSVATNGQYAVMASNGAHRLNLISVVNKSAPKLMANLSGVYRAVTIVNNQAYVLDQNIPGNPSPLNLSIYDLPSLNLRSSTRTGTDVTVGNGITLFAIKVVNNIAYIATQSHGLQIFDVSNVNNPRLMSTVRTSGVAIDVVVDYPYIYVASDIAVDKVNVNDPANPFIVQSLPIKATRLSIYNNSHILYVLDGQKVGVVDISQNMQVVSTVSAPSSQGIANSSSELYLASPDVSIQPKKGGLYIFDITTPILPQLETDIYDGFGSGGIATSGGLVVATAAGSLRVVDVSNPATPNILARIPGVFGKVATSGKIAYVPEMISGNPGQYKLESFDLSAPGTPVLLGTLPLAVSIFNEIQIVENTAYLASSDFKIVNITDPKNMSLIAAISLGGPVTAMNVVGQYAYLGIGKSVSRVDFSDPAHLNITTVVTPVAVVGLTVVGDFIYVIGGNVLITIDAKAMSIIGQTVPTTAQYIVSYDKYLALIVPSTLYHANPDEGVYLYDVSQVVPVFLQQVPLPGTVRVAKFNNSVLYVGDSSSTVDILSLNITTPLAPTTTSTATAIKTDTSTATTTETQTPTQTETPTSTVTPTPIKHCFWGDVNKDDKITAIDASLVLQHVVGLIQLSPEQQIRGDVNQSSSLTAIDASFILQYVVGLRSDFPAGVPCH